jgi:hypothetical protein
LTLLLMAIPGTTGQRFRTRLLYALLLGCGACVCVAAAFAGVRFILRAERKRVLFLVGLVALAIAAAALIAGTYIGGGSDARNSGIYNGLSKMSPKERHGWWVFSTPAYRQEVLRLIIEEANRVALELNLQESLPICRSNLVAAYIEPPHLARSSKSLGNISTSNYTYCVSVGNKFSYLVRRHCGKEREQIRNSFLLPTSLVDTNAAYQTAAQILSTVSVDVNALNRDCRMHVYPCLPEGKNGAHFVPVYTVSWIDHDHSDGGCTAQVDFFQPTRTVYQLLVNDSKYILRKPLEVTNLDYLLSQTNAQTKANAPAPPQ